MTAFSSREQERHEIERDFIRINKGSPEGRIMPAEFMTYCHASLFTTNRQAHAALNTFAKRPFEGIDIHEFILFRAASTNYRHDRDGDASNPLVHLRRVWLFKLYDFDDSGSLTVEELGQMIKELAAGESHTEFLMKSIGINESVQVDFNGFNTPVAMAAFRELSLDWSELLQVLFLSSFRFAEDIVETLHFVIHEFFHVLSLALQLSRSTLTLPRGYVRMHARGYWLYLVSTV
jgi:Ca2+-binding EF-hand superfamily protein